MTELWDRFKSELDKAGKVAQEAVGEGKIRFELFRLRQGADRNAEALGYEIYRAHKEGRDPGVDAVAALMHSLSEQDAQMQRLEAELRALNSDDAPSAATPSDSARPTSESTPPPAGSAPPPSESAPPTSAP
jgi:hypothetical protein